MRGIKIEQAEIDLDVAVGCLQAAPGENALAGERHAGITDRDSRQLERAISLHGGADLGRALRINIETAIGKLARQDGLCRLLHQRHGAWIPDAGRVRRVHPQLKENVIRFEGGVGRQIGAPETLRRLLIQQLVRRAPDSRANRSNPGVLKLCRGAHRVEIVVKCDAAPASSDGNEKRTSSSTSSSSSK